jgi:uncharacterized protein YecE (DUF72 family)
MSSESRENRFWIGTSGWSYKHWQGRFYPDGIKSNEWLEYYTQYFRTVEVNASFYRLPFKGMVSGWAGRTPPDFMFVFKGSRRVTHFQKLYNVKESIELLLKRLEPLKDKILCILWQLPPSLKQDLHLLEGFLAQLPSTYRYAMEFRHASWINDSSFHLLSKYKVAHCTVSAPGLPCNLTTTTDFAYIRFHGIQGWYNYNYSEEDLLWWRDEFLKIGERVNKVLAYFNNDFEANAVRNGLRLQELLKTDAT